MQMLVVVVELVEAVRQIFFESENAMDNDYTISSNHNALVAGPLTINATLTINSPSVVTIP